MSATRMMKASSAPAEVAGSKAQRHAERGETQHRREADAERDARAVHDGREHVAPLVVGAEQVLGCCPFSVQAGGVKPSDRFSVALSKGLCGAIQGANSGAADADERQQRGEDGDRRAAEAPGQVVLPGAPQPAGNRGHRPGSSAAAQSMRAKRDSGRSSALCTVVTFLFIAHGRSWWCSGT